MSKTRILPEQSKNLEVFDDQKAAGTTLETGPINLEEFLQGVISQLNRVLHTTVAGEDWHADLAAPSTFEGGAKRGVDATNQALHDFERKRLLTINYLVTTPGVTVGVANVAVLGVGELPTNQTAAVGAVTTLGTVVAAHTGTFGDHSLDAVTGANSLNPKNIISIVQADTRLPLSSGNRRIFALMQTQNATDGHTMISNAPNGVQLSFVRINGTGDALEACPVGDIGSREIGYAYVERIGLEDFDEQVLLPGAVEGSGGSGTGGFKTPFSQFANFPPATVSPAIVEFNNTTFDSITQVKIPDITALGIQFGAVWASMQIGDRLVIRADPEFSNRGFGGSYVINSRTPQVGHMVFGLAPDAPVTSGAIPQFVEIWPIVYGAGGGGAPWVEDIYVPTLGQITFVLSSVPTEPASVSLHANGVEAVEGTDYTLSGLTLTWLNTEFSFVTSDGVVIQYK